MSYERQNSTSRLEQYRARQAERIEAMSRAIDEGKTTVVSSVAPPEESPRRRVNFTADLPAKQIPAKPLRRDIEIKRLDTGVWVGSRKSVTATSVETSLRQPIHVTVAVQVRREGSQSVLKDGQLFSYDAESGQMIPVVKQGSTGVITTRARRVKSQHHVIGNRMLKVK